MVSFARWTLTDSYDKGVVEAHAASLSAYRYPLELMVTHEGKMGRRFDKLALVNCFGVISGPEDADVVYSSKQRIISVISVEQAQKALANYGLWLLDTLSPREGRSDLACITKLFIAGEHDSRTLYRAINRSMDIHGSKGTNVTPDEAAAFAAYYVMTDRFSLANDELGDMEKNVLGKRMDEQGRRFVFSHELNALHQFRNGLMSAPVKSRY